MCGRVNKVWVRWPLPTPYVIVPATTEDPPPVSAAPPSVVDGTIMINVDHGNSEHTVIRN